MYKSDCQTVKTITNRLAHVLNTLSFQFYIKEEENKYFQTILFVEFFEFRIF